MEGQFLLSIIVPIYNLENYLKKCLESILTQSMHEFELILVDDGSKDKSLSICRKYADLDRRIKLVQKQNGGAASARNVGIKAASGKYILFIDGDDYIKKDSLKRIFNKVDEYGESDIVFLKSLCVLPNKHIISMDTYDAGCYYKKSHEEVLSYLASHDPLPVCVWGKLIKREILIKNNIYFTEGIIIEDVDFCMRLYMHAKTYHYIDVPYYYYRMNRIGSVMSENTDRKYYDLSYIISIWIELSKNKYIKYAEYIHQILAFQYCMLLPMYQKLPKEQRRIQRKKASAFAWLLGCSDDNRVKLLNVLYKLFGFHFVAYLLFLYDRLKSFFKL